MISRDAVAGNDVARHGDCIAGSSGLDLGAKERNVKDWPRFFATAAIWLGIEVTLGFGLYRRNFGDPQIGRVLLIYVPAALIGGAVIGTWFIWRGAFRVRRARKAIPKIERSC
jgi:hypothetical protein